MRKILVPFGMLFVGGAFVLLFWNEGRTVRTAQSLAEGARTVVSASAGQVDAANEGKLVHMTGEATTTETLSDPDFGVSVPAIKLERRAEMYEWKEDSTSHTDSKSGGGSQTTATYSYSLVWSPVLIESSAFKERTGHENPHEMPVKSRNEKARKVTLGAFTLSDAQVDMLDKVEDLSLEEKSGTAQPPITKAGFKFNEGGYYKGTDPAAPAVGDIRVAFHVVRPATVSIVARQIGNTFEAYHARAGESILLVSYGTLAADSMFKSEEETNVAVAWGLRVAGLFMMVLGLFMMFRPIAGIARFLPVVGTLLSVGEGLVAGIVGFCLTVATIALGWLFFRPLLGIGLLVLALAGIAGLIHLAREKKKQESGVRI